MVATKIPQWMATKLNAVLEEKGTTLYDIMQLFLFSYFRHTVTPHEVTTEMSRLISVLGIDAGWQNAFRNANPDNLSVAQLVMILEHPQRQGFEAVMIDKPFINQSRQTENVDDILERVVEVTQQGIYRQIRQYGASMGAQRFTDVITSMLGASAPAISADGPQIGTQTAGGRHVEFGNPYKTHQHYDVDSPRAQRNVDPSTLEGD